MSDQPPPLSTKLEDILVALMTQQLTLSHKIDDLIQHIAPVLHPQPSLTASIPRPYSIPAQQHRMKLEVPRFDGADPIGWIFKVNQFFDYHSTPEHERLQIAAFYMEGRALSWFQWMSANAQFTSWPAFIQALQTRFAPSQYEDPIGTLCKLMQKGTIAAYLSEFEDVANRIVGIPPAFLLSCFISGLTPEIRREVQAHQPLTLTQAAGLAKLQEEKLLGSRPSPPPPRPRPPSTSFFPTPPLRNTNPLSLPPSVTSSSPRQSNPLPSPNPRPNPPPPFKRLTSEEIASHRERGLCFSCDEKYHRGHRCASRVFLLLAEDGDTSPSPETPFIHHSDPDPDPLLDPAHHHNPYPTHDPDPYRPN